MMTIGPKLVRMTLLGYTAANKILFICKTTEIASKRRERYYIIIVGVINAASSTHNWIHPAFPRVRGK